MRMIKITGAALHERRLPDNTFCAWYVCNVCGQELGGAENKKTADEAKLEAHFRFDVQSRNYCYTCGNKLTDKQVNFETGGDYANSQTIRRTP